MIRTKISLQQHPDFWALVFETLEPIRVPSQVKENPSNLIESCVCELGAIQL